MFSKILCSVFCPHLIEIQKIIPVTELPRIWWEYVCYGHHLTEFNAENCIECEVLGFQICLTILANQFMQFSAAI